jgi:glucose/arabinose dehydrogenase
LELVVDGLAAPIGFAVANDGTNRLFILEQEGRVQAVADGQRLGTPFLDIVDRVGSSSPEQGLLGLAFHPNYPENGYFYVNYTDRSGNTVVARYQVTEDANLADPASEVVLLAVEQPAGNHNGGHLVFGPDGYLYIGLGDGGGAGDTYGNAQNLGTLLGAILRIDVDGGEPYAIPPDNPFVGRSEARPEIWAYGLRNPWRFSFDWENGDLWIADVGQNQYEEVNVLPANLGGQNYGWPMMEGLRCFEAETCDQEGLVLPVAEYDHGLGCSVTGGYVYRGAAFPNLQGVYFFGDYCSGHVWGMVNHGAGWQTELLVEESGLSISSFGQDEAGELYLVDQGGGLYRIVQQ